MATHKITETHKAIVDGQNTACEAWPSDLAARQNLIRNILDLQRREAEAMAAAKAKVKSDIGASEAIKLATKNHGYRKLAIRTLSDLMKITDPQERSVTGRQILEAMKDEGILIPELFDVGAIGVVHGTAVDDKPIFDNTGAGKARGGAKAAPKHVEPPKPVEHVGTGPGLDLAEAERQLESYLALNPRKSGAKPKALKELEANVEAAKAANPVPEVPVPSTPAEAAQNAATIASGIAGPDAPDEDEGDEPGFAELPAAEGPLAPQLAAGVAESEAHIQAQIKASETPAADAVAEVKADKPKRPSKAQKEAAAKAKADEEATKAAPAGPDAPDEDETPPFAELPPAKVKPIGGTAQSTVRFAA